jgi:hypothetical protein
MWWSILNWFFAPDEDSRNNEEDIDYWLPEVNSNDLGSLVDSIIWKVNWLSIITAKSFIEDDLLTCKQEDFEKLLEDLVKEWFEYDVSYDWRYDIKKVTNSTERLVVSILKKFKYKEG